MIPFQLHRRIPFVRRPFYQRDKAAAERDALLAARVTPWDRVKWIDDHHLSLDGVSFRLSTTDYTNKISANDFVLLKDRLCLDALRDLLAGSMPRHILDIGIFQGGSVVFYDLLFNPELLVAVELQNEVPALSDYIATRARSDRLTTYFGTSQDDRRAISQILADHFPNGLDLIVDDASHLYAPTRATFEAAFPSLRPHGWYVIEDWGWNHWQGEWQEREILPGVPLSKLVLELAAAQPSSLSAPDGLVMIDQVHIIGQIAAFRRGPGVWPQGRDFRLDDFLKSRLPIFRNAD